MFRLELADELDAVLTWMDENTDGKPYGVAIFDHPAKAGAAHGRIGRVRRRRW